MTQDKMDKSIRSSMLDDFLSDEDKPTPPKPTYTAPSTYGGRGGGYQGGFDFDKGDSTEFAGEDGTDALDDVHRYRPASRMPLNSHRRGSVFDRTVSHGYDQPTSGDNTSRQLAAIVRGGFTAGGHLILTSQQVEDMVNAYMKEIGLINDRAGLVWSTNGLKYLRASLTDLIGELFSGSRKIVQGDPDTGEIEE